MGPVEDDREGVRTDPLSLPDKFMWDELDLQDDAQVCSAKLFPIIIATNSV